MQVTPSAGRSVVKDRPLHIEIHKIEVNRKGDVKRIVDEELALLAAELERP